MSGTADPWAAAAAQYQQEKSQPQATQTQDKPEQKIVPYLSQTAQGLWGGVKSTAELLGKGVLATTNPTPANQYDFAQTAIGPNVRMGQQAAQDVKQGNYGSAVEHGVAAAVPGYGPAGAGIVDKAKSGDWTGAAADATSLGALSYLGAKAPGAVEGIGDALGALREVDPAVTFRKGVPVKTKAADYLREAPTTLGDIKQVEGNTPITDIPTALDAVGKAQAINRAVWDMHADPYRQSGAMFSGAPIEKAMLETIPMDLRLKARISAKAAQEVNDMRVEAAAYNQPLTLDELRAIQMQDNAALNDLYHGTASKQSNVLASNTNKAAIEARVSAIRNIIRQNLGDDAANINVRYGNLEDVRAGLDAAYETYLKNEAPRSGVDKMMKGLQGRAVSTGKAALNLAHGNVVGAGLDAAQAIAGKPTINDLIRSAFENVEPSGPLPTPGKSGMPGVGGMPNAAPTSRQLPPATPQLNAQTPNASMTTSGMPPAWQQNAWQGIGAPKALPPGNASFTQGTSAVNPSAMRGPVRGNALPPGRPNVGEGVITVPPAGTEPWQVQQTPRMGAAPADTSYVRGVPAKAEVGDMMGPKRTMPTADSVAVQAGRAILDALRQNPPQ